MKRWCAKGVMTSYSDNNVNNNFVCTMFRQHMKKRVY